MDDIMVLKAVIGALRDAGFYVAEERQRVEQGDGYTDVSLRILDSAVGQPVVPQPGDVVVS